MVAQYPTIKTDKDWISLGSKERAEELDLVIDVISAIRNIRGENHIKPSEDLTVRLNPKDAAAQKILQANFSTLQVEWIEK